MLIKQISIYAVSTKFALKSQTAGRKWACLHICANVRIGFSIYATKPTHKID